MNSLLDQTELGWDFKCNQDLLDLLRDDFDTLAEVKGEYSVEGNTEQKAASQQHISKLDDNEEDEEQPDVAFDVPSSSKCSKAIQKSRAKACREKARREKLNESFVELAKQVESSKSPKTDKMSILSDAIKMVKALKVENNQLKQLNKFLEEKVSSQEKAKGSDLYQSYMNMMQQATSSAQQKVLLPQEVKEGGQCSNVQTDQDVVQGQQQIQPQMQHNQILQLQQMLQMQQINGVPGVFPMQQQLGTFQVQQLIQQQLSQNQLQIPQNQQYVNNPWVVDPQVDMQLRPPAA